MWTLTAGGGPTPISGKAPVTSGPSFSAGTYALSESTVAGYEVETSWACVGGTPGVNSITLDLGQSATCTIVNKQMPTGCTGTLGFWKQQHTYLMKFPVYLGTPGGLKTTTVTSIPQAVSILGKDQCNGPSNAITGMDAQLLAAKFSYTRIDPQNNAVVPQVVADAITAADAFRATYNCSDWVTLTNEQKQQAPWNQVSGWATLFDQYNNGLTEGWPKECEIGKDPSATPTPKPPKPPKK
jgi:hypothetical protein